MARLAAPSQKRNTALNQNDQLSSKNAYKVPTPGKPISLKDRIFAIPGKRFTQLHNMVTSTFSSSSSGNKTATNNTIKKEGNNNTTTKKQQFQHDPSYSSITFAYSQSNIKPHKRKRARFECVICLNNFTGKSIPHCTDKCNHNVCRLCTRQYFQNSLNQLQGSFETIPCPSPDCKESFITDQVLYHFFSKSEVKKWWNAAIIKSFISNKISCPFCKAVIDADACLLKQCTYVRCYDCNRGLCITCQQPWHPGKIRFIDDEEQLQLTLKKAKDNNWARCPNCLTIIEKIAGCTTIYCQCKTTFCYRCGGVSDDHTCRNRCQNFNSEKLRSVRNPMFAIEKKPVV